MLYTKKSDLKIFKFRFKVFAEVKKDIDILLQHKSDFLENNEPSLTNSETHQGVMDQIAILKGELEEKNRQISALLNIISSKNPTENSTCPLQGTVSPWKHEKMSKTLQNLQTAHHRRVVMLTHLKRTLFKQII